MSPRAPFAPPAHARRGSSRRRRGAGRAQRRASVRAPLRAHRGCCTSAVSTAVACRAATRDAAGHAAAAAAVARAVGAHPVAEAQHRAMPPHHARPSACVARCQTASFHVWPERVARPRRPCCPASARCCTCTRLPRCRSSTRRAPPTGSTHSATRVPLLFFYSHALTWRAQVLAGPRPWRYAHLYTPDEHAPPRRRNDPPGDDDAEGDAGAEGADDSEDDEPVPPTPVHAVLMDSASRRCCACVARVAPSFIAFFCSFFPSFCVCHSRCCGAHRGRAAVPGRARAVAAARARLAGRHARGLAAVRV